mmetsp:Transcript_36306/g.118608  ORF Transcript_36306/g.118608 Transcript_36306/m.118608 type:complete len:282 (+) Transcript_36306:579-1424(+)
MTRGLVGCRRRCSNLSVGASLLLQLRHAAHERLDLLEEEGLRLLLVGRRLVELLQQPHVRLEGRDSGRIQHAVKEEAKEVERLELALLGDLHQSLHADGDARLCVLLRLRLLQRRADLVADLPLLDLKLVEPLLLHRLLVADALLGRLHLRVRRLLHLTHHNRRGGLTRRLPAESQLEAARRRRALSRAATASAEVSTDHSWSSSSSSSPCSAKLPTARSFSSLAGTFVSSASSSSSSSAAPPPFCLAAFSLRRSSLLLPLLAFPPPWTMPPLASGGLLST